VNKPHSFEKKTALGSAAATQWRGGRKKLYARQSWPKGKTKEKAKNCGKEKERQQKKTSKGFLKTKKQKGRMGNYSTKKSKVEKG